MAQSPMEWEGAHSCARHQDTQTLASSAACSATDPTGEGATTEQNGRSPGRENISSSSKQKAEGWEKKGSPRRTRTRTTTTTTKKKKKKTKTTTTMMMMMILFFVFFALLGLADAPGGLREELATIAEHVRPPLPTPLMAAGVLVVVFKCLVNPLDAAWSRLARVARRAEPRHPWVKKACVVVKWVDIVVRVFRSEDENSAPAIAAAARAAAQAAQAAAEAARQASDAARAAAAVALRAEAGRAVAESERDQARADLDKIMTELRLVEEEWGLRS